MQTVFDGHNDALLRLWRLGDHFGRRFLEGDEAGHLDLPRARKGGFMGGFFAVYAPAEPRPGRAEPEPPEGGVEDKPPIGPLDPGFARRTSLEMAAILIRMARARPDAIRLCLNAEEIEAAEREGALAAILHLEGAEAIGPDFGELEVLHAAGLRSLGPVWSRPNIFGTGAPFRFPGDPDEGAGLTDAGRALIDECRRLGIMIDLSHMNAKGVREIARLTGAPLVATHSNVHALSPAARNLTDDQISAIAETAGVVGLNYATPFLREDGRRDSETALTVMIRHLDHLLERLGEGGVALGSDFDGALIPREIGDVSGLPALVGAMRQAGYGDALVDRICRRNWIDLLRRTLGG